MYIECMHVQCKQLYPQLVPNVALYNYTCVCVVCTLCRLCIAILEGIRPVDNGGPTMEISKKLPFHIQN